MSLVKPINAITGQIVDAAYSIHSALGPGLLESVYGPVMARALEKRGLRVERQVSVPFEFEGMLFDQGLRVDLLVESRVVVELLINFGAASMKDGLRRIVNGWEPGLDLAGERFNEDGSAASSSVAP